MPPLISDTETGSETEVKHQQQLTRETLNDEPENGTLLPDAIPLKNNRSLPDLVASSPKLSGSDSPPFEDAPTLSLKIGSPDTTWLEVEAVLNRPNDSKDGPVFVVTAPTPTTERPPDNLFIEESKLIVPKEQSPVAIQDETPTSFDSLLLELRQRKAKNKAEAEAKEALKPLATETAKMQMSKYFDGNKKKDKSEEEVKVVELQVKSKLSDKVEKKDMLKYFSGASFEAKALPERSPSPVTNTVIQTQNDSDLEFLDELNEEELDLDEIEEEFRRIERQNKISLELLKSTGDKRRLSDSQMIVQPIDIMQINKKSRDDNDASRVSVADMVSKINSSKSSSNLFINWNANDKPKQSSRKSSLDGVVVGKLSPALQRKFSYDSASKPVVRVVKKNGSPAVLRRLSSDTRRQIDGDDTTNKSFEMSRKSFDAEKRIADKDVDNDSFAVAKRSSDDSTQKKIIKTEEKMRIAPIQSCEDNGNSTSPRKLSESNITKPFVRETAKNGNSALPPRKMSYDGTKQLIAQDNIYRKRSYDSVIDRNSEVDVYTVTPRSPLLDRLDSIRQMIKSTSSDLEDKVYGPKTVNNDKSSSIVNKDDLKSPLLVSKLNNSNVTNNEKVEIDRSRSLEKKLNDNDVKNTRVSKSPSPNRRMSQVCNDSKPVLPMRKSIISIENGTEKPPLKLNEQSIRVPEAMDKVNDVEITKKPVPSPRTNGSDKTANTRLKQPVPLVKTTKEQVPVIELNEVSKLKEKVLMPMSSSLVKEQQKTIDLKPKESTLISKPKEETTMQSTSLVKKLNEPQRVSITSSEKIEDIASSSLLDRIASMKQNIQKIVVHEQDLLPIRVTEVKIPERLSARLETYPIDSLSTSSNDSLKRPGRRRPSDENLSRLNTNKNSSSRLTETPLSFRKRNGTLSGSFKSTDSARARKDKCVIS